MKVSIGFINKKEVDGDFDLYRFFMECHEELYKCIRGYKNNCIYKYKKLEIKVAKLMLPSK